MTIASATLSEFALTCLVIELTPGPNMAYLAVLSATQGRRAGYLAMFGIAGGLLISGLIAAFGLAAVISNSRPLYEALRWGGFFYFLWLAYEGWREAGELSHEHVDATSEGAGYFKRGLIINLLNPKAAVFFVAVLPTFVDPAAPVLEQTVTLSIVYVLIATAVHGSIVTLAGAARPFLEDRQRSLLMRRVLSLALVAIAVWLVVNTAH